MMRPSWSNHGALCSKNRSQPGQRWSWPGSPSRLRANRCFGIDRRRRVHRGRVLARRGSEIVRRRRPPAFDQGDELDVAGAVPAQEAVDLAGMAHVVGTDHGEGVELDPVALEQGHGLDHPLEAAPAAMVDALGIVELRRTVDAQADQKPLVREEPAPILVQADSVRLQGVPHRDARPRQLALEGDRPAEEVQSGQGRPPPCQAKTISGPGCAARYSPMNRRSVASSITGIPARSQRDR